MGDAAVRRKNMKMTENEKRMEVLFDELVPRSGKADSLAGEMIRAINRLDYRWFNDGDQIGVGYGNETCNAAARFLLYHGNQPMDQLISDLWGLTSYSAYAYVLDLLIGETVNYVESNPHLRELPTEDMFDYYDEEVGTEPEDY